MKTTEERINHPSFGMISISKVNGCSNYLFGSDIQPSNYIEVKISNGEEIQDLTNKRYYKVGKNLIRVKMSPAQFSELITTLNCNDGTPCTIEVLDGKPIPQVNKSEVENRKDFVNRKFRERMKEFSEGITENYKTAVNIINKKILSSNDQQYLKRILDGIICEVKENIPFYCDCFREDMERMVVDAKAEIDAAIQNSITKAGIESLKNGNLIEK